MDNIVDIREYDVPYHVRVSIDKQVKNWDNRCCRNPWLDIDFSGLELELKLRFPITRLQYFVV